MSKRINFIPPDPVAAVLDRVTNRAMRQPSETEGKANLRASLKEEALANAERDLAIAAEWFPLEEEAARLADTKQSPKPARKRAR